MEWQKRLYEYEQAPEPDQWPALSEHLHPGAGRLAGRLSDMEAAPPEDVWPAIAQAIAPPARQATGLLRRIRGYAVPAAAACLAFLALRISLHTSADDTRPTVATAIVRAPLLKEAPAVPPSPPAVQHSSAAAGSTNTNGPKKNRPPVSASAGRHLPDPRDANYLEVCDPRGLVCNRINYKLEGMAECLHARTAVAASEPCNRELKEWVDRMEHSSYVPAPGHFFDIVELAASLREER